MSKPNYVCECREWFDNDTGISQGGVECFPCAAWSGVCECVCDCGQCLYTETPCGRPPNEVRCQFCDQRKEWSAERLSEVKPIISQLELKIAETKDSLALAIEHRPSCPPGGVSETYARLRLEYRLEPCLKALNMIQDKSEWASAVIAEVKNVVSGLEGQAVKRMSCGIQECSCHLRTLNAILAEKMSAEAVALDAQIVAAEDARHAARDTCAQTMKAWEDATFSKNIAIEMLEEAKWDTGLIQVAEWNEEMRVLNAKLVETRAAEYAAGEAYAAAGRATGPPAAELRRLHELKKSIVA